MILNPVLLPPWKMHNSCPLLSKALENIPVSIHKQSQILYFACLLDWRWSRTSSCLSSPISVYRQEAYMCQHVFYHSVSSYFLP